jgi:hypothetical protein
MRTLALVALLAAPAAAATIAVAPGGSIQAAVDAAADGDVVTVAAGTFAEHLDFRGKAITVVGAGPATVIAPPGEGPVVRFTSGEGAGAVLEAVTVTGGLAERGGGILIEDASPTIRGTVITANRARSQGSGVYLRNSTARLENNLITFNATALGDPHGVEVQDAGPTIVNNTIARGDSNGLILRGVSPAVVLNNVFAYNGTRARRDVRGRGICDFSGGLATIQYNLFYRNRKSALLSQDFVDYKRIRTAERRIRQPRLSGNVDGQPRFVDEDAGDFSLAPRSRAIDIGHPDPAFADPDGSRNDAGFTGGPLAP